MVGTGPGPPRGSGQPLRSAIPVIWHEELGSTNDEARRLAEAGAPAGTIVAALRQTAGKGRHGRRWDSLPGNLHASFLRRPAPSPEHTAEIGLGAALAVAEALAHYLPPFLRPGLKWPNDVLLAEGKIAGILLEAAPDWVVLGIGVNLAAAPGGLPYPAEALATFAAAPAPAEFLQLLVTALDGWLTRLDHEGFSPIAEAWLGLGPAIGEEMRVRSGDETVSGRFAGLGSDGALLLEISGEARQIHSGEVLHPAVILNDTPPKETGGPAGPEPTRYGDWQVKGRVSDF